MREGLTDIERLDNLFNYLKISRNALGVKIGDKNGMRFQNVYSGRNGISPKLAKDITEVFPEIEYQWLLSGKGEMLQDNSKTILPNKNGNIVTITDSGEYYITVPLIEFSVYAGKVNEYQEAVRVNDFSKEVTFPADHYPKGRYLGFKISGYSMDNGLRDDTPDGAIVLARELGKHHWKDGFYDNLYGWVIISIHGMVFKDIVIFDSDTGNITLHSRNTSPEFTDFELSLNDIFQIFKVIKRIF